MEADRRRVLVLAYYFPPVGGAGVQRTLKFVKYLSALGWDATVISTRSRAYGARDESLSRRFPRRPGSCAPPRYRSPATSGTPSTALELMRLRAFVLWPDGGLGWMPFAFLAALGPRAVTGPTSSSRPRRRTGVTSSRGRSHGSRTSPGSRTSGTSGRQTRTSPASRGSSRASPGARNARSQGAPHASSWRPGTSRSRASRATIAAASRS